MRSILPTVRPALAAALLATVLIGMTHAAKAADGWLGEWSARDGDYSLLLSIRRGTRDPSYLRAEIGVGITEQCAGGMTAYGKPDGNRLLVESYDPKNREAPVCRLRLEELPDGRISIEEDNTECSSHHRMSCDFNGEVSRAKR